MTIPADGLDARSVANLLIRISVAHRRPVTHLSIQKILYFIHGRFLLENKKPLLSGYFEAWPYGPVHPLIYESFKDSGARKLIEPATKRDILSGRRITVPEPDDLELTDMIYEYALPYLKLSAGRLVDLSHAQGTPWDVLTKQGKGRVFGQRITDSHILERFQHHKVSIEPKPKIGEPDEESPPY